MWTLEAIAECLTRRARKQHDPAVGPSRERAFDSNTRANAWYGASASRGGGRRQQPEAMTRCDAVLDSGRTRGDDREETSVCLHFARGRCSAGGECAFLHRLPTAADDARASLTHDVFGRDRHATHCADNGGVGSFSSTNDATLFAYYGGAFPPRARRGARSRRRPADFLEWGPVSGVRVVPTKCVASRHVRAQVRRRVRQGGDGGPDAAASGRDDAAREAKPRTRGTRKRVLSVRWANADHRTPRPAPPRPAREETAVDAVARVLDDPRVAPERRRALPQARALATDPDAYPDTDASSTRANRRRRLVSRKKKRRRGRLRRRAAPPTQAAPPAIDALELERIRAAVGVVPPRRPSRRLSRTTRTRSTRTTTPSSTSRKSSEHNRGSARRVEHEENE